jgi:hypothetical protein
MSSAASTQNGKREYRKSGLFTLRRQLIDLGSRAIDGRSSVGVALRRWKAELIDDLGGEDLLSTQQQTLIELAARSKIMLDSVDNWILAQPTLVNARKKTILSVVQQRQVIADGLTRIMKDLGLERRSKEVTLKDYLSDKYGDDKNKGKKRESRVHVDKPASDSSASPLVKETDLDA